MAQTKLLLWGRNDDGQLGIQTLSSITGSPLRKLCRGTAAEARKKSSPRDVSPTRKANVRPEPGFGSPSRSNTKPRASFAGVEASTSIPTPCPIFAGIRVLHVSCGSRHTLAVVAGGEAYSWGWGTSGQLGHGDDLCSGVPRVIEALNPGNGRDGGGAVTCVSAGGIHSAAVVEGGAVFTWGGSSFGQLGHGNLVTAQSTQVLPRKVMLPPAQPGPARELLQHKGWTKSTRGFRQEDAAPTNPLLAKIVACGGMHTAALTEEGVVYCWGRADNGQLGIGSEWVHETTSGVVGVEWPARVGGLLQGRRTVSISCGGFHTAAVTAEGECYTWGKEDFGMLGCSNEALLQGGLFRPHRVTLRHPRDDPSAPTTAPENVVAVACGGWHTAVIGERGGLWMCGRGEYGRLGLGDQTSQWLLTPVVLEHQHQHQQQRGEEGTSHGSGGFFTGVADAQKRRLWPLAEVPGNAGGNGSEGPEAEGGGAVRSEDPVTMVALGGSHSLTLTSSGKVFAFGRQEHGRLGTGTDEVPEDDLGATLPIEVRALKEPGWRVQSISCGGVHSAAILVRETL